MSDAVWFALIVLATQVVKEYFDRQRSQDAANKVQGVADKADLVAVKAAKVAEKVEKVAVKADETAAATAEALAGIAKVGEITHGIVNSQRTAMEDTIKQLRETIAKLNLREAVTQERAAERGVDLPRMPPERSKP